VLRSSRWRLDCLPGVVRLELRIHLDRNPFELRREFLPDLAKRMIRDVSRVSCALATLQLRQGFWQVVSSGRAELASGFGSLTRAGRGTRSAPEREARPSSWVPAAAAIRSRDDLQKVAFGVLEVDTTSPVVAIDFIGLGLPGISPVGELPVTDSTEDFIEL
jgi:hypothetical protein